MHGLLDVLEVPRRGYFEVRGSNRRFKRREPRRSGFWVRNAPYLHEMLHDIRASWRRRVRRVKDNHELAVEVNLAWAKVKRLFARRGVTL